MNREQAEKLINSARERSNAVVRLAMLSSIAASISPGLLRALRFRLMPGQDAGVESDFWFSNLVATHNALGITLNADVADVLRGMLKASGQLDAAYNVIAQVHAGVPTTLQVEEEILWRTLRDEPGDASQVEKLLQRAVKTMVTAPHRANDIARWADRALQRFPTSATGPEAARMLAAGAYLRVGTQARMAGQHDRMQLPKTPQWLAPSSGSHIETVGVRLLDVGLEFVAAGTPGSGTIAVPDDELRLVQLEWSGPSGDEMLIAESRVGSTAALPAYVTNVKLRTMNGTVYRIEAQASTEATKSMETPSVAESREVAVDRYRVAKVLVVGANSAAKTALFAELSGVRPSDSLAPSYSWRAPVGDDGVTKEFVFWNVPDEPVWLGALSAELAAAVIIVDSTDSTKPLDPWLPIVNAWLDSNPFSPQVIVVRAASDSNSQVRFELIESELRVRWAEALEHPLHTSFVDTNDGDHIQALRKQLVNAIEWHAQLSFDSPESYEVIERSWLELFGDRAVLPNLAMFGAVQRIYGGHREPDAATVRAASLAGNRGTMRPLDWPAADVTQRPYRCVTRAAFDEGVDSIVAKLTDVEHPTPFAFFPPPLTVNGEIDALIADEFWRLRLGLLRTVTDGRWLVVPAAARSDRSPREDETRYHLFGSVGAGDAQQLWFFMLLELQQHHCTLQYVGSRYATVVQSTESGAPAHDTFGLTLEGTDPVAIALWSRTDVDVVSALRFASLVENALNACLPAGGRVFEEDFVAGGRSSLTIQLCAASVDRGRPFTRFVNMLRDMLRRTPDESILLIAESEDAVYEGADLFVAMFSEPFVRSEWCMQEIERAANDERDGRVVVAPFIWEYPPLDAELLNRFQPFDLVQETGRSLFELCEHGTDDELQRGLSNYVALIRQRLDDRSSPDAARKREESRVEYDIVPNVTTREQATQMLATNLMQKLAMVFHVGSLHPSQSVEQTEYFHTRSSDEQKNLMHARFVSEYIYAQEATKLLQNGEDPFSPTIDEVRAQYSEAITLALGPRLEMHGVVAIMEKLREESRYLTNAQKALDSALGRPIAEAIGMPAVSTAALMREQPFIAIARDLLCRTRQAFLRFPTSMSECPDFATYIEQLSAVIQRYAEWAARQFPESRAFLYGTFPDDVSNVLPALPLEPEKDNRGVSISARDYPMAIQQTAAIVVAGLRQSLAAPRPTKSVQ